MDIFWICRTVNIGKCCYENKKNYPFFQVYILRFMFFFLLKAHHLFVQFGSLCQLI